MSGILYKLREPGETVREIWRHKDGHRSFPAIPFSCPGLEDLNIIEMLEGNTLHCEVEVLDFALWYDNVWNGKIMTLVQKKKNNELV